jgi:phosphoserine phosphatase
VDLGGEVRKAIAGKAGEIERDVQRKMDRFASAHKGKPVETIKPALARFWSSTTGQRMTPAQLQETAQAIHNGDRIPTRGRVRWQ